MAIISSISSQASIKKREDRALYSAAAMSKRPFFAGAAQPSSTFARCWVCRAAHNRAFPAPPQAALRALRWQQAKFGRNSLRGPVG